MPNGHTLDSLDARLTRLEAKLAEPIGPAADRTLRRDLVLLANRAELKMRSVALAGGRAFPDDFANSLARLLFLADLAGESEGSPAALREVAVELVCVALSLDACAGRG